MSLFELPVSRGARLARIGAVLALNAVLVGAGVAMMISYGNARARARGASPPEPAAQVEPTVEVEVLPPAPVLPERARLEAPTASAPAARRPPAASEQARPTGTAAGGDRGGPLAHAPAPGPVPGPGADPAGRAGGAEPGPTSGPGSGGASPPQPPAEPSAPGQPAAPATDDAEAAFPGPPVPADEEIQSLTSRVALEVSRNQGQLERCYQQAAKTTNPDHPLEGRIDVQFEITGEGRADKVRVVADTTGSDVLGGCVVGLLRSWSFPEPPGGLPLEFVWPFRFRATQ